LTGNVCLVILDWECLTEYSESIIFEEETSWSLLSVFMTENDCSLSSHLPAINWPAPPTLQEEPGSECQEVMSSFQGYLVSLRSRERKLWFESSYEGSYYFGSRKELRSIPSNYQRQTLKSLWFIQNLARP
jgi:hypothetical protein